MSKGFSSVVGGIISGRKPDRFLETERLMEAWYCLKNDHVTVVVDGTRPRVSRIYTHGKFGDFQNLLYSTNAWGDVTGEYGIVPCYELDGERVVPFVPHAYCFENFGGRDCSFDQGRKVVHIRGVDGYVKGQLDDTSTTPPDYDKQQSRRPAMDLRVQLVDDELAVEVSYPRQAEKGILAFDLYPLYTHYTGLDGERHCVEYMRCGLERENCPRFDEAVGSRLVLEDGLCVLPRLTIWSDTGVCRLISHTDWDRNNAARLVVLVETKQPRQEVRLALGRNPVTLRVDPLLIAQKPVAVQIESRNVSSCRIDGVERRVDRSEEGSYRVAATFGEGGHEIVIITPEGFAKRNIYAVNLGTDKVASLSDALTHFLWQDEEKRDIISYAFHPDTLEPLYREGAGFIVHAVRALTTLFLGAVVLERPQYAERGFACLKAIVGKSHSFDNGDLLVAIWLDKHGKPNPATINACRPSDLGIMIRGSLYAAKAFRHFGQADKSAECLDYAARYARTFFRMQRQDGAFYSRYSYPDLNPATKMVGTVNNWMIQVWNLAKELQPDRPQTSEDLREMVGKYVDFSIHRRRPSILEVAGGADEGPANYADDLATTAAVLAIQYVRTGQAKYKDHSEQALRMNFFHRNHRLDSPYDYMYPLTPHMGPFYDFPHGVPAKGDMTDLTGNEAALFLKDLLGYDLGEYVAAYCTAGMFTDCYNPNGALYSINVHVPNYTHVMKNYSDVNVYGALGVVLFWLLENRPEASVV